MQQTRQGKSESRHCQEEMKRLLIAAAAMGLSLAASAQDDYGQGNPDRKVTVHGSVQVDALFPEDDAVIGTEHYKEKLLGNVYANAGLFSKYVDAGLRVEYLQHPLPGFERQFKGWGVPNFFATGKYKGFELTAGDIYEQFGSGLILRTYEERSLGIDNSIRGGRLKVDALPGFRFTVLGGVQRVYWDWSTKSRLYGADVEWDMQQHIKAFREHGIVWTWGASYVHKKERYEEGDHIFVVNGEQPAYLNLPTNVGAADFRTQFYKGGLNVSAEVALKNPDPSLDNGYTFANGHAVLLTAGYSMSGFSGQLRAKRSENMAYRTRRSQEGIAAFINNMPAFAYQHTYALAAMYPYATQNAPGEWAFQGNFAWTAKRRTPFGGRYGTKLRLNVSYIRGLDHKTPWTTTPEVYGTNGNKTAFWKMGELYYEDINLQLDKKFSSVFTLNAMYMYQRYNQTVIEGHGGMVNSHIAVAEGKFRISQLATLRAEVQFLATKQDKGNWLYGLIEASITPYVMVGISDQWNCGGPEGDRQHYYMFNVTGNYRNNRLMLGYGRTRAGYNCSGGVCRYVPATRGFQLSYNYNF